MFFYLIFMLSYFFFTSSDTISILIYGSAFLPLVLGFVLVIYFFGQLIFFLDKFFFSTVF